MRTLATYIHSTIEHAKTHAVVVREKKYAMMSQQRRELGMDVPRERRQGSAEG